MCWLIVNIYLYPKIPTLHIYIYLYPSVRDYWGIYTGCFFTPVPYGSMFHSKHWPSSKLRLTWPAILFLSCKLIILISVYKNIKFLLWFKQTISLISNSTFSNNLIFKLLMKTHAWTLRNFWTRFTNLVHVSPLGETNRFSDLAMILHVKLYSNECQIVFISKRCWNLVLKLK